MAQGSFKKESPGTTPRGRRKIFKLLDFPPLFFLPLHARFSNKTEYALEK
jgi:hypothetical protein